MRGMKTSATRVLLFIGTLGLLLALAIPASAGQLITYRGQTSQDRLVELRVLKKESGRRFLCSFVMRASAQCDDESVFRIEVGVQPRPSPRLGDGGEFELGEPLERARLYATSLHAVGVVKFRRASGTVELVVLGSTAGEPARKCETGELDWSAERHHSRTVRPS